MSFNRTRISSKVTRRAFAQMALSIPALGFAGSGGPEGTPTVERTDETDARQRDQPFGVVMLIDGGLLKIDKANQAVEIAYPGKPTNGNCHAPYHPMVLALKGATLLGTTGSIHAGPWQLDEMVLEVEVPGSPGKPKPDRWREKPQKEHPEKKPELEDLDWIPTIHGKADDWASKAATRVLLPTGEFYAADPVFADVFAQELWEMRDTNNKVVSTQYLTDQTRWEDTAKGPVTLRFKRKNGTEIGTATIGPGNTGVCGLELSPDGVPGEVKVGELIPHYCIYDSLLKDLNPALTPFRTGKKFTVSTRALVLDDPVPGKFCPGGKLLA